MKLTSVEIHPKNSTNVAVLSFRDPRAVNPYNVKQIDGLDAESVVPKYYGASGNSNDKFYHMSLQKRTIVIRISLNPSFTDGETYSDLRDALYRMIASARTGKVQLQFKNGATVVAVISGFVSKFESPHFEKTQEIKISIEPDDPMLKALTPTNLVIPGLNPANTPIQDDVSTAPHGVIFDVGYTASTPELTITDPTDASWSFIVTPVGGFLNGDILHFSSDYNEKELYITRGGTIIYLADVITPGSAWPIIFPGANHLALSHAANLHWNAISYYKTYWGV